MMNKMADYAYMCHTLAVHAGVWPLGVWYGRPEELGEVVK